MESRGCLGILVFTVVAVLLVQGPDDFIVDGPRQALSRPVYAVLVESRRHFERRIHECRPVVAACDAFAEVVCLHCGLFESIVIPTPLPIDFVSGVGHEHSRGDDACPGGGLHYYIDVAVQEVTGGPDIRCIIALFNWEDTAVLAVCTEGCVVCDGPAVLRNVCGSKLGEVGANG